MLARFSMLQKWLLVMLPLVAIIFIGMIIVVRSSITHSVTNQVVDYTRVYVASEGERILEPLRHELAAASSLATLLTRLVDDSAVVAGQNPDLALSSLMQAYMDTRPHLRGLWLMADAEDRMGPGFGWFRGSTGLNFAEALQLPEAVWHQFDRLEGTQISDPYHSPMDGELVVTILLPLDGVLQEGALGLDVEVMSIQQAVLGSGLHGGLSAMFGQQGTIVGHPDSGRLGAMMADTEADFMGDELAVAVAAVKQAEAYMSIQPNALFAEDTMIIYEPVPLAPAAGHWSFAMAMPMSSVLADVDKVIRQVMLIGLACLVLLVLLIFLVARSMTKPLKNAVTAMQDIASGEGDMTRRLPVVGRDEFASLALEFNAFVDSVGGLIRQLAECAHELSAVAASLHRSSQSAVISADKQMTSVDDVSSAMHQLTASVQEVAGHAQQASSMAQDSTTQVCHGKDTVNVMVTTIQKQCREIDLSASNLAALEQAGSEIEQVILTIQSVAEQTNLLALNAAIEAARAGELGRGFAVVADEVRNLASRTQQSTDEIGSTIQQLQDTIRSAVASMRNSRDLSADSASGANQVMQVFQHIDQQMQQLEQKNGLIAGITSQQSRSTETLAVSLQDITQLAEGVAKEADITRNNVISLERLAEQMSHAVNRFKL